MPIRSDQNTDDGPDSTRRDLGVLPAQRLGYGIRRQLLHAGLDVEVVAADVGLSPVLLRQVLIGKHLVQWDTYEQILQLCDVRLKVARELRDIWYQARSFAVGGRGSPLAGESTAAPLASTKEELAQVLREIRALSGRSMADIIKASGIPRSSAYNMVAKRKPVMPAKKDVLIRFLTAAGVSSARTEEVVRAWTVVTARRDTPRPRQEPAVTQPSTRAARPCPGEKAGAAPGRPVTSTVDIAPRHHDGSQLLVLFLVFLVAALSMEILVMAHPGLAAVAGAVVGLVGIAVPVRTLTSVVVPALGWTPASAGRHVQPLGGAGASVRTVVRVGDPSAAGEDADHREGVVQYDEVGLLAGGECADPVLEAEHPGGCGRQGRRHVGDGQAAAQDGQTQRGVEGEG